MSKYSTDDLVELLRTYTDTQGPLNEVVIIDEDEADTIISRLRAADALLSAAKTTCLHFKRMSLYPDINFMGDDEHEAWRLLRTAISAYEEERDGRKG